MSRKKVSTTIYITPEQADRLKVLHERTKVPISVYIREGIDMMLKHYEHVLPGQMSLDAASLTAGQGVPGVPVARLPLHAISPTPAPPPVAQVAQASPTPAPPQVAPAPSAAEPSHEAERAHAAPRPSPSQTGGAARGGGHRAHKHAGSSRSSGEGS